MAPAVAIPVGVPQRRTPNTLVSGPLTSLHIRLLIVRLNYELILLQLYIPFMIVLDNSYFLIGLFPDHVFSTFICIVSTLLHGLVVFYDLLAT